MVTTTYEIEPRKDLEGFVNYVLNSRNETTSYKTWREKLSKYGKYDGCVEPFVDFLNKVDKTLRNGKRTSDLSTLFPRLAEHFRREREYLDLQSLKDILLYIAVAIAHVASHNRARSVKIPEKCVEEIVEEANEYFKRVGINRRLRIEKARKYEPGELYEWLLNSK